MGAIIIGGAAIALLMFAGGGGAETPESFGETTEYGEFVKGGMVFAAEMRGSWSIFRQGDGRYTWLMRFPGRDEVRRDIGSLQAAEQALAEQAQAWGWTLHGLG